MLQRVSPLLTLWYLPGVDFKLTKVDLELLVVLHPVKINEQNKKQRIKYETDFFLFIIFLERVRRIELPYSAWEAGILPLNYTRKKLYGRGIPLNHVRS